MEHDKIICLDIETVPDRTLIPEWDEGKFPPKPIWHQVVAISFVEAQINDEMGLPQSYAVTCCRSGGDAGWDEQRLLAKFWQYFSESAPRVVTWNGKGFVLPVLRVSGYRARSAATGQRLRRWSDAARSTTSALTAKATASTFSSCTFGGRC